MSRRAILRGVTCVVAVSGLVLGMTAGAAGAAQPQARAMLADTAPAWMAHAKNTGKADNAGTVNLRVYLAPKGGLAAEQAAVTAVATPGNPSYRHFITPAQYNATYAPTKAEVSSVSSWLTAQGLKVTGVDSDRQYVSVRGSVAAAQQAFGVSVQKYSHDGQNVQAPSGALSVPAAVASQVLTVTGLDTTKLANTFSAPTPAPTPPAPTGFNNARPCSIFYGQIQAKFEADFTTKLPKFDGKTLDYAPCGYTGPQLRAAYEGNTNLDGAGITVATTLWFASPTIASDTETYAENNGDGSYAKGQFTQAPHPAFNLDPACDPSGVASEEALDIEAVHAMAPAANIRYYAGKDCFDTSLADMLGKIVKENKVQLVTDSWGAPAEGESAGIIPVYEQVFMQGGLQGISFMFSSGDNGDELANTGIKQADYPTSDPFVTSVGGTSTAIDGNGNLQFQTGWGVNKFALSSTNTWTPNGFLYGAGGGFSTLFNRPTYQNGVVPASAPPGRAEPDVAMDADPTTGMLIGLTQTFPDGTHYGQFRIGGTSLASPLFAGMTALAFEQSGGPVGLLNPTIYGQAKAGTFTDVAGASPELGDVRIDYTNGVDPSAGYLYSVRTFNQDSTLSIATGWDPVTGIGSPNTGWLTSLTPMTAGKKK
ncbi:MAG TPA: S53 family peptidase [Pseudonocardiaceae bacterium]|jgi:subtilase family serine protease|nr:S53 family peptidase [Pseudonocardiaceae bacterium]